MKRLVLCIALTGIVGSVSAAVVQTAMEVAQVRLRKISESEPFGHNGVVLYRGIWWINLTGTFCKVRSLEGETAFAVICDGLGGIHGDLKSIPFGYPVTITP